jgi:hypothetical protein
MSAHPAADVGERASDVSNNLRRLREAGIGYEAQFGRPQVIIRRPGRTFEFWPSTGRWRERDMSVCRERLAWNRAARQDGHGVESLLDAIGAGRIESAQRG